MIANRFSALLPGRIAVGLAAGVVTLTGAATAAYACVLPNPIQSFAHTTIGAPKPSDPKLSVAAVDAGKWKHYPTPSASVTPTPTSSVSVSASVSASVTATATASTSPTPKFTKKPVLDPTQLAAVQALVDYRLCQSYTALTKAGKTLDPKALALLEKAAGSSTPTAIAAYCAALPAPPSACLTQPVPTTTASPSATPSDKDKDGKKFGDDGWWRWCGICPKVTVPPSPTPTASATATATPGLGRGNHYGWFWCGDRDKDGHSGDPSATPTAKPTPKMPFPGQQNWFGNWGNGQGNNGGQRDGTPTRSIQGNQHH